MQEKWTRWEHANDNLAKKYSIESMTETIEGRFEIILSDRANSEKVYVSFPDGVEAYRNTNESYTLEIINHLDQAYSKEFYAHWTFFRIENSEYLEWLADKSHGVSDDYQLMHFCILGLNAMIDIACFCDPIVSIEKISADQEVFEKSDTKNITENSEKPVITDNTLGKKGRLEDGRLVSIRKYSHDGNAMMEIFDPKDKKRIKIRYCNNS